MSVQFQVGVSLAHQLLTEKYWIHCWLPDAQTEPAPVRNQPISSKHKVGSAVDWRWWIAAVDLSVERSFDARAFTNVVFLRFKPVLTIVHLWIKSNRFLCPFQARLISLDFYTVSAGKVPVSRDVGRSSWRHCEFDQWQKRYLKTEQKKHNTFMYFYKL